MRFVQLAKVAIREVQRDRVRVASIFSENAANTK
jgi:hypothetical protein